MDDLLELPSAVHLSVVPPLGTPCSHHGIELVSDGEGLITPRLTICVEASIS